MHYSLIDSEGNMGSLFNFYYEALALPASKPKKSLLVHIVRLLLFLNKSHKYQNINYCEYAMQNCFREIDIALTALNRNNLHTAFAVQHQNRMRKLKETIRKNIFLILSRGAASFSNKVVFIEDNELIERLCNHIRPTFWKGMYANIFPAGRYDRAVIFYTLIAGWSLSMTGLYVGMTIAGLTTLATCGIFLGGGIALALFYTFLNYPIKRLSARIVKLFTGNDPAWGLSYIKRQKKEYIREIIREVNKCDHYHARECAIEAININMSMSQRLRELENSAVRSEDSKRTSREESPQSSNESSPDKGRSMSLDFSWMRNNYHDVVLNSDEETRDVETTTMQLPIG